MTRKKMTTYVDEGLLRSAEILAAKRDGKIYEVFEEAPRRYLEETDGSDTSTPGTLPGAVLADRRRQ